MHNNVEPKINQLMLGHFDIKFFLYYIVFNVLFLKFVKYMDWWSSKIGLSQIWLHVKEKNK
jgi:hypothetical protein